MLALWGRTVSNFNSHAKRDIRSWIRAKYEGRCCYCQKPAGKAFTIDHYVPLALGGTNARRNLRLACRPCNEAKADMSPMEWRKVMPKPEPVETAYQVKVRLISAAIKAASKTPTDPPAA